ncbi:MAG: outer membrane beta-barrel protein [Dysgonomonas sp.]
MKKLILLLGIFISTAGAFAQKGNKSVLLNLGYQTDYDRLMLGGELRYGLTKDLRIAPDFQFFVPNDHVTGLDINANLHYVVPLQNNLDLYPLAGLAITNNRVSVNGWSNSDTDVAFNLGAGLDYNLNSASYLNFQFKYMFQDNGCAVLSLGYGIRF